VNTDEDPFMDELHIYFQVNVTKSGTYPMNFLVEVHKWRNGAYGDYDQSVINKSITQYLEKGIHYIVVKIDGTMLYSIDFDTTMVEFRSIRIFDSDYNLCASSDYPYSSNEYSTHIFFLGESTLSGTSVTMSDLLPNSEWFPSWNVPFGIVVLSAISILLYLLQRTRRH
jgi:hypothetical protein